VPLTEVAAQLQALLTRTGDWRSPEQFTARLGVSLPQFCSLVNLRDIGALTVDMCCHCGVFVTGDEAGVGCEHCVDVYHLRCVGLKKVRDVM
jgi:hypothetical protein